MRDSSLAYFLAAISNNLAFRLPDDPWFQHYLRVSQRTSNLNVFNRNRLANVMLDRIYAVTIQSQMDELRRAPGFCISYDGWTSGSHVHSVLALVIHFVDTCFRPQSILLDLIPMKVSHTARNMAVALMTRLGACSADHHVLYGSVTDNAANVVAAGKLISSNFGYDDRLTGLEYEPRGADMEPEDDGEFFEFGFERDLTEDENGGMGDVENEDESVHTCADHTLELCVKDVRKKLVRLNNCIEKGQSLVVAIKGCHMRQLIIYEISKTTVSNPKLLWRDVCTRWRCLYKMLQTLIPVYCTIIYAIVEIKI